MHDTFCVSRFERFADLAANIQSFFNRQCATPFNDVRQRFAFN